MLLRKGIKGTENKNKNLEIKIMTVDIKYSNKSWRIRLRKCLWTKKGQRIRQ